MTPRPLVPPLVAAAAALVAVLSAFLPWYAPDIAPPLTPDSVSGWDGTTAARLMVAGAVICTLLALVLVADARDLVALDALGARAASAAAAVAALGAFAAVAFRTVRLPEPSAILARQAGLYLALLVSAAALGAALVEVLVVWAPREGRRTRGGPPASRSRRRRQ